jgi:hypothetical protein
VSVAEAFRAQARHCTELGSPFTARLCTLLADHLAPGDPVSDRVLSWPGDPSNRGDALPLRLAGALHGLVLEGRDPGLAAAYPPNQPSDERLRGAVKTALGTHAPFILRRLDGPPQTNEVQRSAALAPGFLAVAALTGLPLATSELGASAGLNMIWDSFAYAFGPAAWGDPASPVRIAPAWDGPSPPLVAATVAERVGCDRDPPDVGRDDDRLRLLSYIWADQTARLARAAAAIELARAAGIRVARGDAADWLDGRLAAARPGRAHVVCHSVLWSYLPVPTRERIEAALAAAGARATTTAPLAWLRLEGHDREPAAVLTLTLWPGGETRVLARSDFHCNGVRWRGW